MRDPKDRFAEADGAFIGELVSSDEALDPESGELYQRMTFELQETFKGSFLPLVEVRMESSCPEELEIGEATGLFAFSYEGGWRSSSCGLIDPEGMRDSAAPLPEPDGNGPPRYILGGSFGEARTITLDGDARVLGYGYGNGWTIGVSPCADGTHFVEAATTGDALFVGVRSTDQELLWEKRVWQESPQSSGRPSVSIACVNKRDGAAALVGLEQDERWSVLLLGENPRREVASGHGRILSVDQHKALFVARRARQPLVALDLDTGRERVLRRRAANVQSVATSSGRVAVVAKGSPDRFRLTILGGRVTARRTIRSRAPSLALSWPTRTALAVVPVGGRATARLFDDQLTIRGKIRGWNSVDSDLDRGCLVGTLTGRLRLEPFGAAGCSPLKRTFFSPETYAVAAL